MQENDPKRSLRKGKSRISLGRFEDVRKGKVIF